MAKKSKSSKTKPPHVRRVVNEGVEILQAFGVPLSASTNRQRELASMCFLAVCGVTHPADWPSAGNHPGPPLRTRQIIEFVNKHFSETMSPGSYDDIRRKHLRPAVMAGVVMQSAGNPQAAANDPTRGYGLNPEFAPLVKSFGQMGWAAAVSTFMTGRPEVPHLVSPKLAVTGQPLIMPDGTELKLGPGQHNALQRSIIEQFRPRFAPESSILYLGDADERVLYSDPTTLKKLAIDLTLSGSHPDVIIWDSKREWVFLIEAVHSFGPISQQRIITLEKLCANCPYPRVFVTAFLDRNAFRRWAPDIAWETEGWIAAEPDHMIHFNGDRFLGPRLKSQP